MQVVGRYFSSPDLPFATFRSMFVANGDCDVDDIVWTDASGATWDEGITGFRSGQRKAFLFRTARSLHNTSAGPVGGRAWVARALR